MKNLALRTGAAPSLARGRGKSIVFKEIGHSSFHVSSFSLKSIRLIKVDVDPSLFDAVQAVLEPISTKFVLGLEVSIHALNASPSSSYICNIIRHVNVGTPAPTTTSMSLFNEGFPTSSKKQSPNENIKAALLSNKISTSLRQPASTDEPFQKLPDEIELNIDKSRRYNTLL